MPVAINVGDLITAYAQKPRVNLTAEDLVT
jgi:hypothetical protein